MPGPSAWNEQNLSEDPAVDLLQALGYTYIPPETLEHERGSLKEAILAARLAAALRCLNPWSSEANVTQAIRRVTRVTAASLPEANQAIYTSLTYGVALDQGRGEGRKSRTVRFFDFDEPQHNDWIVTRQYRVRGAKKDIIPDIVVFVNGLPLVIIECKSPTLGDGWKAEAVKQLRRYQEADERWKQQGAPKLFETAQILVGTCGERAVYGTLATPERYYFEWKEPYPLNSQGLEKKLGREPTAQDTLLYGLLEPRNLLDIVRNFVVFNVEGGRMVRKLARYKQFMAVNKAMRRIRTARKPATRGGVIWHTQGSGKSLTMLWLALKLRRDQAQQQPTIVIVTDRTKLDAQIAAVFTSCGFPNPERATSVRDLRRMLKHPIGKTVMTTIQKFQELDGPDTGSTRRSTRTALKTDGAKASEMEHAIRHEINVRVDENPDYYQSLRERLEQIIKERREERIDAAQQLARLDSLREDLKGEGAQAQDIGLTPRAFAIYGLLQRQPQGQVGEERAVYGIGKSTTGRSRSTSAKRDLALQIDRAIVPFTGVVDWQQKDDEQRRMRRAIKKCLRRSGYDDEAVDTLAEEVVDLAKGRNDP